MGRVKAERVEGEKGKREVVQIMKEKEQERSTKDGLRRQKRVRGQAKEGKEGTKTRIATLEGLDCDGAGTSTYVQPSPSSVVRRGSWIFVCTKWTVTGRDQLLSTMGPGMEFATVPKAEAEAHTGLSPFLLPQVLPLLRYHHRAAVRYPARYPAHVPCVLCAVLCVVCRYPEPRSQSSC